MIVAGQSLGKGKGVGQSLDKARGVAQRVRGAAHPIANPKNPLAETLVEVN